MKDLGERTKRLGRGESTATGMGHTEYVMMNGEQQPTTCANNTLDLSRSSRVGEQEP